MVYTGRLGIFCKRTEKIIMDEPKTTIEKLEYLSTKGWLVVNKEKDAEENQELIELGFSALVLPKIAYSIEEAYRLQKIFEKESNKEFSQ